jgi:hypothetical protein
MKKIHVCLFCSFNFPSDLHKVGGGKDISFETYQVVFIFEKEDMLITISLVLELVCNAKML